MTVTSHLSKLKTTRLARLCSFSLIGTGGVVIDLTVVSACLLAGSDLLIANAAGWTVAVTANFLGNYWFTYTCPAGRLSLMYVKYVASRSVTFGLRSVVALLLVGVGDVGDLWASMAGILVGVSLGFALAETVVFGGGRDG